MLQRRWSSVKFTLRRPETSVGTAHGARQQARVSHASRIRREREGARLTPVVEDPLLGHYPFLHRGQQLETDL